MSRVVLIAADRVLEHQARVLLGDEVVTLSPAPSGELLTRIVSLPRRPELVVLGSVMPGEMALSIARTVRQLSDVVALVSDDFATRDAAREAGVAAFLPVNAELEDVEDLLERSRALVLQVRTTGVSTRRDSRVPGRIITVISPKGGVGKTTVAVNLAVGLARSADRVVLVDLDLQFGDVAGMLGVDARQSVVEALGKSAARDDFVLRTLLVEHPSGISVLAAPESPAAADRVDPARIGHLLRQLAAEFDHVVIDTSPGLTEPTLAAVEQSTGIVAVGGLDMSSLRGLSKSLELLRELEMLPRICEIVLNAVDRAVGITVTDAESVIGARVDVVVPRRRAVAIAGNHALPVIQTAPRDPAAKSLLLLVRRLDEGLSRRDWRDANRREPGRDARPRGRDSKKDPSNKNTGKKEKVS